MYYLRFGENKYEKSELSQANLSDTCNAGQTNKESEEDNDESESMEIIENYRSRYGRVVKKNPKYLT